MIKKTIVIGLSGGVDSAVAAKLLLDQGYDVIGVFMRNWDAALQNDQTQQTSSQCIQDIDFKDAQLVANHLKIPLYRVDFSKAYWDQIFTYLLHQYQSGRTPNPDVFCNKYIKFDKLLHYIKARFHVSQLATGHYAGVSFNETLQQFELHRGQDATKDQSYFLSQLNQAQLSQIMFPLWKYSKTQVRVLAHQWKLPVATKKDSVGICFIGRSKSFKLFLQNYIPINRGPIVDIDTNEYLQDHDGVSYYTIGQRKGLVTKGGTQVAYYLVGKNIAKNIIYVSKQFNNPWLHSTNCTVTDLNWINSITFPIKCTAKFRYLAPDEQVTLSINQANQLFVKFDQPSMAVTPGQFAVFYQKDICIGSGVINQIGKDNKKLWFLNIK